MKPSPTPKAKAVKPCYVAEVPLQAGEEVVFASLTTPQQVRAAAGYLLDNMPPVARKGQKTARQVLAELRGQRARRPSSLTPTSPLPGSFPRTKRPGPTAPRCSASSWKVPRVSWCRGIFMSKSRNSCCAAGAPLRPASARASWKRPSTPWTPSGSMARITYREVIGAARDFHIQAKDAPYLMLAKARGLPLATIDSGMRNACQAQGLALLHFN